MGSICHDDSSLLMSGRKNKLQLRDWIWSFASSLNWVSVEPRCAFFIKVTHKRQETLFLYYTTFTLCSKNNKSVSPACWRTSQKWGNYLLRGVTSAILGFKCSKRPILCKIHPFWQLKVSSSCHWTDYPWKKVSLLCRIWMELITRCYASNVSNSAAVITVLADGDRRSWKQTQPLYL